MTEPEFEAVPDSEPPIEVGEADGGTGGAWGFLLLAIPAILVVGFRGNTRDTVEYIDIFKSTTSFPMDPIDYYLVQQVEWLFGVICWAIQSIGLGWRALFLLIPLLTWSFLSLSCKSLRITLFTIAPFYLGTFFLTQQLMQIRQGLAIAVAFYVILDCEERRPGIKHVILSALAIGIHMVSALPIIAALAWRMARNWKVFGNLNWTRVGLVLAGTILAAMALLRNEFLFSVGKLSLYVADEEFSGARGYLAPANLRATLLLVLFVLTRVPERWRNAYNTMLILFTVHLGLRIGFNEFEILSGRLASALGFSEVFLLALALHHGVQSRSWRFVLGGLFLVAQTWATLSIQVPYLIHDYFSTITG
jgi:EpsG family